VSQLVSVLGDLLKKVLGSSGPLATLPAALAKLLSLIPS
jgi:hypothetical protein